MPIALAAIAAAAIAGAAYLSAWGAALGCLGTLAAICAALAAFGWGRAADVLAAIADALERAPEPEDARAEAVAGIMRRGYSHGDAEDAVSRTAKGRRTRTAWERRALRALSS